jgi:hypothetical protein
LKLAGVLSDSQLGFLKNKSTITHLLECCLDWNIALPSKKAVDIIYLDFAKAFDSVIHKTLTAKLCCKMILFHPLSCSLAWMLFLNGQQAGS